jgi:hypothetical protein
VITEELRQHVFSDRKDRLPYSFMILIEENSVALRACGTAQKHGTNKHTK